MGEGFWVLLVESNRTHSVPKLPRCSHVEVGKARLFDQVMIFKGGWKNVLISLVCSAGRCSTFTFFLVKWEPYIPHGKEKGPCLSSLWWGIAHRVCLEAKMIDAQQRFLWLFEQIALACDFVSVFGWRPGSEAFKLVNLHFYYHNTWKQNSKVSSAVEGSHRYWSTKQYTIIYMKIHYTSKMLYWRLTPRFGQKFMTLSDSSKEWIFSSFPIWNDGPLKRLIKAKRSAVSWIARSWATTFSQNTFCVCVGNGSTFTHSFWLV